jgi:hypothetical protein
VLYFRSKRRDICENAGHVLGDLIQRIMVVNLWLTIARFVSPSEAFDAWDI